MLPIIKVYDMDYAFLMQNYLSPELWTKTWTLFEYKKIKVELYLYSIQIKNDSLCTEIKVTDASDYRYYTTELVFTSLKLDPAFMKRQVNSAIWRCLQKIETAKIRTTDEFEEFDDKKDEEYYSLKRIAEEFLDEAGINNEDIRDSFIDVYTDQYAKMPNLIEEYLNEKMYTEYTELFLAWLNAVKEDPATDGRLKDVQKHNENVDIQSILEEIQEYTEYMNGDNFAKDAEDCMDEVLGGL